MGMRPYEYPGNSVVGFNGFGHVAKIRSLYVIICLFIGLLLIRTKHELNHSPCLERWSNFPLL